MISVEFKATNTAVTPTEIEINLDKEGLSVLLNQLEFLRSGRTDHVHFMSQEWGGDELSDVPCSADAAVVHHLKIKLR